MFACGLAEIFVQLLIARVSSFPRVTTFFLLCLGFSGELGYISNKNEPEFNPEMYLEEHCHSQRWDGLYPNWAQPVVHSCKCLCFGQNRFEKSSGICGAACRKRKAFLVWFLTEQQAAWFFLEDTSVLLTSVDRTHGFSRESVWKIGQELNFLLKFVLGKTHCSPTSLSNFSGSELTALASNACLCFPPYQNKATFDSNS